MLSKNEPPQSFSPFLAPRKEQEQKVETPEKHPPENNKSRSFRRAGNVCEIVAGSCLNSAVIFTFHLMQVHPVGIFLAVGTAHLYFTATATGEGLDKVATNAMTGASASLALFCALSEPIGEWWEARESKTIAQSEIKAMYSPSSGNMDWVQIGQWGAIAIGAIILLRILTK